MVDKMYDAFLVDKVFVSPSSRASDILSTRDIGDNNQLTLLRQVHGSTQEFLDFISTSENICVVVIDFAGLSTNTSDLYDFVQANGSIKKIIVDLSVSTGMINYYNREDIIDNPSVLKDFDCRKPCYKRS